MHFKTHRHLSVTSSFLCSTISRHGLQWNTLKTRPMTLGTRDVYPQRKRRSSVAFSKHRGSGSLQIIDIVLAAVSLWLVVKHFGTQIRYSEVIALFRRSRPLGFVAVLEIHNLALRFVMSSPHTIYRLQHVDSLLNYS